MSILRKIKREDRVINGSVLVYFEPAQSEPLEPLFDCAPEIADRIVKLWNENRNV